MARARAAFSRTLRYGHALGVVVLYLVTAFVALALPRRSGG
ncbi:unnamed protein product [[Actinomadura] parvosata subsp. kistnae]|nr:unnamed protein product [Actinomadura parvosata subsp. kistnae]